MQYLVQPFTGLSEFAAGHNDDCGPNAEEVALASVQRRDPSALHMNQIRSRDLAKGWFHNHTGEGIQAIANDAETYEAAHVQLISYGTALDTMHDRLVTALKGLNPVVLNLANGEAIPHNEPGVKGHFVTLGGYDDQYDAFLIADGDYWTGKGVIVNGTTPTFWATWARITEAQPNGAVVFLTGEGGPVPTVWGPDAVASLWAWLVPLLPFQTENNHSITQPWNGKTELGVDLAVPFNTEITSLTYGTVINSFYFGGGGVVVVKSQTKDIGMSAIYYQHLDLNLVQIGDVVRVGDIIGYSGGQLHGGHHPATCCSSGAHLEVGRDGGSAKSQWRGMQTNRDPLPWLQDLVTNGPPTWDLVASNKTVLGKGNIPLAMTALSDTATGQGPVADNFAAIATAIDEAMQLQDPTNGASIWPWDWPADIQNGADILGHDVEALLLRFLVIMIGVVIILAVIFQGIKAMVSQSPIPAATGATAAPPVLAATPPVGVVP